MNEFEPLTIERIDDVPLLLAQLERMQVAHLLDRHFPTHGNWQGLSLGMVSAVWRSQSGTGVDRKVFISTMTTVLRARNTGLPSTNPS